MSNESSTFTLNLKSRLVSPTLLYIRSLPVKFCLSLPFGQLSHETSPAALNVKWSRQIGYLYNAPSLVHMSNNTSRGIVSLQIYGIFTVRTALNELITSILHSVESCEHYSGRRQTLFFCFPVSIISR